MPQPRIETLPSSPYPVPRHGVQTLQIAKRSDNYKNCEECDEKHKFLQFLLNVSIFTKAVKFFAINNSEVNSLKHSSNS